MQKTLTIRLWPLALVTLGALGCSNSPSDAERTKEVTQGMQASIGGEIDAWHTSAIALRDAMPTPSGRGWDKDKDKDAIANLRTLWRAPRITYEHIEGAVAPLFPDIDISTDARYEDFLVELGNKADPDAFDGKGVTGMHAIERIVFSDVTPAAVWNFEKGLPGYTAAALPATEAEAAEMKTALCGKLITDIESMQSQWNSAQIDLPGAFDGLISLMNEQREKVNKAATGEEESRYSQNTLADLRANLEGTKKIYALFQPWIADKAGGADVDRQIQDGFDTLDKAYSAFEGDAIPAPPATWSSAHPSDADLATPFGKLFSTVTSAVDPKSKGSVVSAMNQAASLIGFPRFQEGE
jgi:iron uptake system component EfeO